MLISSDIFTFCCFGSGMFGVLWYVAWFVLAFESPSVHPTISEEERAYIELSAVNTDEVRFSRQIFEHHFDAARDAVETRAISLHSLLWFV